MLNILTKNLKFIPHTRNLTKAEVANCCYELNNRLQWKWKNRNLDLQHNKLYHRKHTKAPTFNHTVCQLIDELKCIVMKNIQTKPTNTITYNATLRFLHEHNLIIKPTDKNLGPAIMDKQHYRQLCIDQLSNGHYYHEIDNTISRNQITTELQEKLIKFIEEMRLAEWKSKYILHNIHQKTLPVFYGIPKIHKPTLNLRPIVSSASSILTNLSKYVCEQLDQEKYQSQLTHTLKNTKQLIDKMETYRKAIESSAQSIITIDIVSLYTNMQTEIIQERFKNFIQNDNLLSCIMFILENNYFTFEEANYIQCSGMAMGTNMAVHIANIYCHLLIDKAVLNDNFLYSECFIYNRYIDDIIIMTLNRNSKQNIMNRLKLLVPVLNFTCSEESTEAIFLDLNISIANQTLTYQTYQKPLNSYAYIPYKSKHPTSLKKGFIKGELIRHSINNSCELTFNIQKKLFRRRLVQRGYPEHFLRHIFNQVPFDYTKTIISTKTTTPICPIIIRYTEPNSKVNIKQILLSLINQLPEEHQHTADWLKSLNFIMSFRSSPNLKTLLTRSDISKDPPGRLQLPLHSIIPKVRQTTLTEFFERYSNCNRT